MGGQAMNFYKHYIGDFQRDTGHLSLTERGAYLCLMHHYYATEKPLPNDHSALCRVAGAITKSERDAVKSVMRFFTAVDSGLMHARIEAEIEKAGKQADTNREIAIKREAARKAERDANESSTNRAATRAPNQTPDTRHQEKNPSGSGAKAQRGTKKAPVDFEPEGAQAWVDSECPGLDWQRETAKFKDHTFKNAISDWRGAWRNWMRRAFDARPASRSAPLQSFRERDQDLAAARVHEMTGGLVSARPPKPIAIEEHHGFAIRVD